MDDTRTIPSSSEPSPTREDHRSFPCRACGAEMVFDPGAGALRCRHCGVTADIPESDAELSEVDYSATLAGLEANSPRIDPGVLFS